MSDYQRFITYLYQRGEPASDRAIGFAKFEQYLDRMRIQIQLRGGRNMDGKWPIFIEDEEGGRQQIDFLQIRKGAATRTVLLQMQDRGICKIEIGEAGYLIEGTLGTSRRKTKEMERQQMKTNEIRKTLNEIDAKFADI